MTEIPRYAVTNFSSGVTSESELTAMCHGKRFHVFLSPSNLRHDDDESKPEAPPSGFEQEYLRLLRALESEDQNQNEFNPDDPDPVEAMFHWVMMPFFPVFRELAPRLSSEPQTQTLHEYFNPITFFYTLRTVDGRLTPLPCAGNEEELKHLIPRMDLPQALSNPDVPFIRPTSLEVTWDAESEGAQYPTKVLQGDTPYFFKSTFHGKSRAMEREIETLLRLEETGLTKTIRVPKLHGYVQFEVDNGISGLLLTHIQQHDSLGGPTVDDAPLSLREKWFGDVKEMLRQLHESEIVWGDAKADNVLIDPNQDVWIIDFGGSYTHGWVDEDKMETIQGDLQGLERIKTHLRLG
ncbi:MAG: hypothetical protein M1837_002376 [Sclerophora amabilis]|nr:MAG: hypothetical protein M1837_002376 [Sclerophora amabilis]